MTGHCAGCRGYTRDWAAECPGVPLGHAAAQATVSRSIGGPDSVRPADGTRPGTVPGFTDLADRPAEAAPPPEGSAGTGGGP
jgi:hypothetical protein